MYKCKTCQQKTYKGRGEDDVIWTSDADNCLSWSISFSGGQTLSTHSLYPHGPKRIYMVFVEETPKYKLIITDKLSHCWDTID